VAASLLFVECWSQLKQELWGSFRLMLGGVGLNSKGRREFDTDIRSRLKSHTKHSTTIWKEYFKNSLVKKSHVITFVRIEHSELWDQWRIFLYVN
jgi:hypothetical protein